ncbi:hypothetical protein F4678DRAFT_461236 [Xylaria arbuscula]|nr:hypothetical protein F4678DRAFT_461236 [Xylaria arbuscula]
MALSFPERDMHDSAKFPSENHRSRSPSPGPGWDNGPGTPPPHNIFFPAKSPFGSRSSSPGPDMNTKPRDIDSISIDSMGSVPDLHGCRGMNLDNERTTTAYEAWEISVVEDRRSRSSWKSLFGIKFGTEWVIQDFGLISAIPDIYFGQGELADMYEDAIRSYKHKLGTSQEMAYEQNLANRVYDLPRNVYGKVQQLIEDKRAVTNWNPHRKREWHVVVLQPGGFQVTKVPPEFKRTSIFPRKRSPPVTRTWFVVLQGQEVKSNKEDGGWKTFSPTSNPWWRLDKRETKEGRDQNKKLAWRYSFPPPPPPPDTEHKRAAGRETRMVSTSGILLANKEAEENVPLGDISVMWLVGLR